MSLSQFFENVLPGGTRYALRTVRFSSKKPIGQNYFCSSFEEMAQVASELDNGVLNVYYATAGFGTGSEANAENAVAKREFYFDIDCGEGKPYPDKAAGLTALMTFCKTVGLPKPTLIDSGNGLHAHWYFTNPVPVHEWKAVAEALKARCVKEGFVLDGGITADIVRVLRIPGTKNTKGDGSIVTLLNPIKHYAFETLRDIIGVPAESMFAKARALSGGVSEETKKLYVDPNRTSKFETIWLKSVGGDGCAQIKQAVEDQESTPEPLWRGVLSIAQFCEDRDWAIHEASKNHPNYSPEETERKAELTKGPYTCETFRGLDSGKLCEKCPHFGKITSPIQLGSEIRTTEKPVAVTVGTEVIEIPKYPWPFSRGANGGIYFTEGDGGDAKRIKVYETDIYIFKRMRDTASGDTLWARHHLPHNDVREFSVLQSEIAAPDKFRELVNREGVIAFDSRKLALLQMMFGLMIKELQFKEKASNMRTRFGWTPEETFVVGNREYTKKGVIHTPVAKPIENYVPWFTPKGDLETWKAIVNIYNAPDMDYYAAGLLAGFGSVLMNLSPENGGVINFYSKRSGTGKTTILRMVNSIFGNPTELMKDAQDKTLTKVHRLGVMNGIASTLDEMTNTPPDELSELLYNNTQGRGRDRMEAGRNAERINNVRWKQMSVWSSNSTAEDRLALIKSDPAGELARILEIPLQSPVPKDVLEVQKAFNALAFNYGHGADVFLRYLIPNLDTAKVMWEQTRDMIYSKHTWSQAERYKLNNVVCITTAGLITNMIDLTKFNVGRIMNKLLELIKLATLDQQANSTSAVGTVANYINKNIRNVLIINHKSMAVGISDRPAVEPLGELLIRYEPDVDTLYITKKEFTRWCAERYINFKEMVASYPGETGGRIVLTKKRMGAGWRTDFGSVDVLQFEKAKKNLNLDGFTEQAETEASK